MAEHKYNYNKNAIKDGRLSSKPTPYIKDLTVPAKKYKCAVCEKFKDIVYIDNIIPLGGVNHSANSYVQIRCDHGCCYKISCNKCRTIALYLHNEYNEITWEYDGRI